MRTTSSYRRSWPGRRLPEVARETPEPAMRQSCATVRAAGGSFCRTGRGCHVDRLPCRPSALAKELAGPSAGAVMGTRPACFMWEVPVSSDVSTTLSNMCSGAGSGADGSAGGGGAGSAGCLDPMPDRLLAEEVAGLPDSALAADLVGLRVAVSRLESEFARQLVVFDRRGRPGSPGRCPPRPGCAGPADCPPGRPANASAPPGCWPMTCRSPPTPWPPGTSPTPTPGCWPRPPRSCRRTRWARWSRCWWKPPGTPTRPGCGRCWPTCRRSAVDKCDPAGAEAAAAAAHDRRRLTVAGTFAGAVVLDGGLDPEGGATVLAALMPLAAPGGADDDRTPAQRRADALVELAAGRWTRRPAPP